MKRPILVINQDRFVPGTILPEGYDIIWMEGEDVPAIQTVPAKADRRFAAACAAIGGAMRQAVSVAHLGSDTWCNAARIAVETADALLAELDKPK